MLYVKLTSWSCSSSLCVKGMYSHSRCASLMSSCSPDSYGPHLSETENNYLRGPTPCTKLMVAVTSPVDPCRSSQLAAVGQCD